MNLLLLASTTLLCACVSSAHGRLIHLGEETWTSVLEGEWMIEFYAPWCPACHEMKKAWDAFADWADEDRRIKVADVDVTEHAGLSGRFLVTSLPSIYHVKDGKFRLYNGPRDKKDFVDFIREEKWAIVDEVPAWRYPTSIQMGVVSGFFKLSMKVRDLHHYFVKDRGLPTWGSYAIFATATLVLGSILGVIIVLMIDYVFPPAPKTPASPKKEKKTQNKQQKGQNSNGPTQDGGSADDERVRQRNSNKPAPANGDAKQASPGKPKEKDAGKKKK